MRRCCGRADRLGRPSIKVTVDLGRGRGEKRYSQRRGDTEEEGIFKWESIYHEAHVGHEEEGGMDGHDGKDGGTIDSEHTLTALSGRAGRTVPTS